MNKNLLTGIAVALSLVVSIFAFAKPAQVVKEIINAGAATNPIINERYFGFGDVLFWGAHSTLTQATTTVCALQSPAATSTLISATFHADIASTSATTITIAKAATAFATTTVIGQTTVAANLEANLVASTTIGTNTMLFSPNQYVVVGMAGSGASGFAGTFSPTGYCDAVWKQVAY